LRRRVCWNLAEMNVIIWILWIFKIDSFKIPKNSSILGNFKIRKIRILNLCCQPCQSTPSPFEPHRWPPYWSGRARCIAWGPKPEQGGAEKRVKVVDLYSASTRSVSKALRYSTHCQGIYLHTLRFIRNRSAGFAIGRLQVRISACWATLHQGLLSLPSLQGR